MSARILIGDCIERLRELPADSVHCVVTSPPYWGLRDYGVEGQIGLEPTPEAWAARLVEVFREVRRVLRPDGCVFLNCGDSYCATTKGAGGDGKQHTNVGSIFADRRSSIPAGLKPKDLIGQPWLLAFALRADGWWLRSEIIWAKPNPMPESVRDRPTKAHEQVFLLTKSASYYYDAEAVREAGSLNSHGGQPIEGGPKQEALGQQINGHMGIPAGVAGRNSRSVWTIATEPFPEAHFATFPTELARRCILAGTSAKGCCPACGAPWARVVERASENRSNAALAGTIINGKGHVSSQVRAGHDIRNGPCSTTETLGWRPTCTCEAGDPVPATVLDPFGGSGTTAVVAEQLGRGAMLIELSPEYAAMAERRIARERSRRMLGQVERVTALPGQLCLLDRPDQGAETTDS